MDAPERGALMLVRLMATAFIGWTGVDLALYWLVCRQKQLPMEIFSCLVKSLPLGLGLVMMVKSKAAARWISDQLDE